MILSRVLLATALAHQPQASVDDVKALVSRLDLGQFRLGLTAAQTTLAAVAKLAGASIARRP
jgi:hypothetical protein